MKRLLIMGLVAATVAPAASAGVARIAIVTKSPLVVTGTRFVPKERVTVTVGNTARTVRVTALGSFRVAFPGMAVDRCSGYRIVALGARGDRALILQSRVLCTPATGP